MAVKQDRRKNNGGHSTKSKGIDKRKNQYRQALNKACTPDDVVKVLQSLRVEAIDGDIAAIKLFLEYYLGKPTQTIEQETTHKIVDSLSLKDIFSD